MIATSYILLKFKGFIFDNNDIIFLVNILRIYKFSEVSTSNAIDMQV